MMSQVHLRRFLVGTLLISVTSAQGCSVCGDGYQVGNPSAITSVSFPESTDTQLSCSDLEFAGLEGLIPSEDCSVLPSLIFETCDCQENTKGIQSHEYTNSLRGSGYSSQRRAKTWFASPALNTSPPVVAPISSPPVAAPYNSPSAFAPISAPYLAAAPAAAPPARPAPIYLVHPVPTPTLDPISYGYHPSYYTPSTGTPTKPQDDEAAIIISVVAGIAVFFVAFAACGAATRAAPRPLPTQRNRRQSQATPTTLPMISAPTPTQLKNEAQARRPLVLAILFPGEGKVSACLARVIRGGCGVCFLSQVDVYI